MQTENNANHLLEQLLIATNVVKAYSTRCVSRCAVYLSSLSCALLQTCIGCIVPSNKKLLHPFVLFCSYPCYMALDYPEFVTKLQT